MQSEDGVVEYKPIGRLDSKTAEHNQQELLSMLDNIIVGVALDLSGVTNLSTAGIRVLLMVGRAA